jgi:hypothetical protein
MSKVRLSKAQYLAAVSELLDHWIKIENDPQTADRLPETARAVFLDALRTVRTHAGRRERVAVVLSQELLAAWLLEHRARYANLRDLLFQIRHRLPPGNQRGAGARRVKRVLKSHPLTQFGIQVEAVDALSTLRLTVSLTAGTRKEQSPVPIELPSRDVPLLDVAPSPDDPMEAILLLGLEQLYAGRDDQRHASIAQHIRRFGIDLPALRKRTIRALITLIHRRHARQFGSIAMENLTQVQRIALEHWYRFKLGQWEDTPTEQTTTSTSGAVAHKFRQNEGAEHPDEELARQLKRERIRALQFWTLERVKQSDSEIAHMRATIDHRIGIAAWKVDAILHDLEGRGLIDNVATWVHGQHASYAATEDEAVALALENGMPPPNVQRAIRRLARPREQSWPERETRKLVEQGPPENEAGWSLWGIIVDLLLLMESPRLDGELELYLENRLRYFTAIYRLLLQEYTHDQD